MGSSANLDDVRSIAPEQELKVLKLILSIRQLGDVAASEKLRTHVREALVSSATNDDAINAVDGLVHRAQRLQSRLDGSHEARRNLKRMRREERRNAASRYVDAEAESGDEDSSDDDDEDEVDAGH